MSELLNSVPVNDVERAYEDLPEAIKQMYSFEEFTWMGAERRARIVQEECSDPLWTEP
jgi:hypothetical protein